MRDQGVSVGVKGLGRVSAVVLAMACASVARGQTSGVWNPGTNVGSWGDGASWVGGSIPANGGVASFGQPSFGGIATVNVPGTWDLTTVSYASSVPHLISNSGTGSVLSFGAAPVALNVTKSTTATPKYRDFGMIFRGVQLAGGPLIKTGPGTVVFDSGLSLSNSFNGGVFILGGVVEVRSGAGDLQVGANNTLRDININGGTLRINGSSYSLGNPRPVIIGAGGGTIDTFLAGPLSTGSNFNPGGPYSGSGVLTKTGAASLVVAAASPLTGNVVVSRGTFEISNSGGNGSMTNVPTFDVASLLLVDNSKGNSTNTNRVGDSAVVRLRGGELRYVGARSVSIAETVGTLELRHGASTVLVSQNTSGSGSANPTELTLGAVTRPDDGLWVVRAQGSSAFGTTYGQLFVSSALPVIGGGAASGTTRSILPWAVGRASSSADLSLVTREASGRVRPLSDSEYWDDDLTAGPQNNVTLYASLAVPAGGATANAVRLRGAGGDLSITGGGPLTLTSGAMLVSGALSTTINAPLVMPAGGEGVLMLANPVTTTAPISGVGTRLTRGLNGNWVIRNGGTLSTYTGGTTLAGGQTFYEGDLPVNTPSALGQSSQPIVLTAGDVQGTLEELAIPTMLSAISDSVISRDILVAGQGRGVVALGAANGHGYYGDNVTPILNVAVNGTVTLQRRLSLQFGALNAPGNAFPAGVINGRVTGTGSLADFNGYFQTVVLNNPSNDFTGGIYATSGRWVAGADNAFGTGPIVADDYFSSLTGTSSYFPTLVAGGGPRSIANPLVVSLGLNFDGPHPLRINGDVDLTGFVPRLTVVDPAGDTVLAGVVRDGVLVKYGPGRLTLAGNSNSYSNAVIVEGTLRVGDGGTSGRLSLDTFVSGGATLMFDRSDTYVYGGQILDNLSRGDLLQAGTGTTALTGSIDVNAISVTAGKLRLGNLTPKPATFSAFDINVASPGTLAFAYSTPLDTFAAINGSGRVAIEGTSTVTFSGDNGYSGGTRIDPGATLKIFDSGANPAGTGTIDLHGSLLVDIGGDFTLPNEFTGSSTGTIRHPNAVTLTLAGNVAGPGIVVSGGGSGRLVAQSTVISPAAALRVTEGGASASLEAPGNSSAYVTAGEFASVQLAAGATVAVTPADRTTQKAKVLVTGSLDLADLGGGSYGAFLDLGNGDLIARGGGVATLRSMVSAWRNTGNSGIGASLASSEAYTTLAVFPNNLGPAGGAYYGTYDGVSLTAADVIVKFTFVGDTNLDGLLDGNDLANLIEGLSTGATGWNNGDLNYDGTVDFADYQAFLSASAAVGSASLGNGQGPGTGSGAIPEPTGAATLLAGGLLLTRRRR